MEFLFIDESGDNGFAEGSTETFSLAGISIEKHIRTTIKHFSTRFNQGVEFLGAGIIEDVVFSKL